MKHLLALVALLGTLLLFFSLRQASLERQFEIVFGAKAPKMMSERIRVAPIVLWKLESVAEDMQNFLILSELVADRPLREGETEETRIALVRSLVLGAEASRQKLELMLNLAIEFKIPILAVPKDGRLRKVKNMEPTGAVGSRFSLDDPGIFGVN